MRIRTTTTLTLASFGILVLTACATSQQQQHVGTTTNTPMTSSINTQSLSSQQQLSMSSYHGWFQSISFDVSAHVAPEHSKQLRSSSTGNKNRDLVQSYDNNNDYNNDMEEVTELVYKMGDETYVDYDYGNSTMKYTYSEEDQAHDGFHEAYIYIQSNYKKKPNDYRMISGYDGDYPDPPCDYTTHTLYNLTFVTDLDVKETMVTLYDYTRLKKVFFRNGASNNKGNILNATTVYHVIGCIPCGNSYHTIFKDSRGYGYAGNGLTNYPYNYKGLKGMELYLNGKLEWKNSGAFTGMTYFSMKDYCEVPYKDEPNVYPKPEDDKKDDYTGDEKDNESGYDGKDLYNDITKPSTVPGYDGGEKDDSNNTNKDEYNKPPSPIYKPPVLGYNSTSGEGTIYNPSEYNKKPTDGYKPTTPPKTNTTTDYHDKGGDNCKEGTPYEHNSPCDPYADEGKIHIPNKDKETTTTYPPKPDEPDYKPDQPDYKPDQPDYNKDDTTYNPDEGGPYEDNTAKPAPPKDDEITYPPPKDELPPPKETDDSKYDGANLAKVPVKKTDTLKVCDASKNNVIPDKTQADKFVLNFQYALDLEKPDDSTGYNGPTFHSDFLSTIKVVETKINNVLNSILCPLPTEPYNGIGDGAGPPPLLELTYANELSTKGLFHKASTSTSSGGSDGDRRRRQLLFHEVDTTSTTAAAPTSTTAVSAPTTSISTTSSSGEGSSTAAGVVLATDSTPSDEIVYDKNCKDFSATKEKSNDHCRVIKGQYTIYSNTSLSNEQTKHMKCDLMYKLMDGSIDSSTYGEEYKIIWLDGEEGCDPPPPPPTPVYNEDGDNDVQYDEDSYRGGGVSELNNGTDVSVKKKGPLASWGILLIAFVVTGIVLLALVVAYKYRQVQRERKRDRSMEDDELDRSDEEGSYDLRNTPNEQDMEAPYGRTPNDLHLRDNNVDYLDEEMDGNQHENPAEMDGAVISPDVVTAKKKGRFGGFFGRVGSLTRKPSSPPTMYYDEKDGASQLVPQTDDDEEDHPNHHYHDETRMAEDELAQYQLQPNLDDNPDFTPDRYHPVDYPDEQQTYTEEVEEEEEEDNHKDSMQQQQQEQHQEANNTKRHERWDLREPIYLEETGVGYEAQPQNEGKIVPISKGRRRTKLQKKRTKEEQSSSPVTPAEGSPQHTMDQIIL